VRVTPAGTISLQLGWLNQLFMDDLFAGAAKRLSDAAARERHRGAARAAEEAHGKNVAKLAREKSRAKKVKEIEEQKEREEKKRQLVEEQKERNGGVYFDTSNSEETNLKFAVSKEACDKLFEEVLTKNIRRYADKCCIDSSLRHELLDVQGAMKNGPVCLELSTTRTLLGSSSSELQSGGLQSTENGDSVLKRTHVVVYSYASKQSTLGIGQKALRNLLDINFKEHESLSINEDWTLKVNVKYVTLPQGISAILQPLSSSFQRDVLDTRGELEKYLKHCCTLTEGEIISLNKKSCELNDPLEDGSNDDMVEEYYHIKVVSTTPPSAISIVETDLEVDLLPSVDYQNYQAEQERLRQQEEQRKLKEQESRKLQEDMRLQKEKAIDLERQEMEARVVKEVERLTSLLGSEAADDSIGGFIAVKFPNGERHRRRFLSNDTFDKVFLWTDSHAYVQRKLIEMKLILSARGELFDANNSYRLVQAYPRQTYTRSSVSAESLGTSSVFGTQLLLEFT